MATADTVRFTDIAGGAAFNACFQSGRCANSRNHRDFAAQARMQAAMLTAAYNIRMTPTLTIGGRYSLSPEVVAGNTASFVQLSNAMVSKYLQEGDASLRKSLP